MGTSVSTPSEIAPSFKRIKEWDIKASKKLLQTYQEKDLDFGLDAKSLASLLDNDMDWTKAILYEFGCTNGILNALAFICGVILVSHGTAFEKAELAFDAFDFGSTQDISMDEMTILFLCCARGYCVVSGVGRIPRDETLETITIQAYKELSKVSVDRISKTEFTSWILDFIKKEAKEIVEDDVSLSAAAHALGITKTLEETVEFDLSASGNEIQQNHENALVVNSTNSHEEDFCDESKVNAVENSDQKDITAEKEYEFRTIVISTTLDKVVQDENSEAISDESQSNNLINTEEVTKPLSRSNSEKNIPPAMQNTIKNVDDYDAHSSSKQIHENYCQEEEYEEAFVVNDDANEMVDNTRIDLNQNRTMDDAKFDSEKEITGVDIDTKVPSNLINNSLSTDDYEDEYGDDYE